MCENGFVLSDETLEELGRGGLRIIQKRRGFRFGTDSILLADFACVRGAARGGDFGTGSAILPLLMSDNAPRATFDAWEIQPEIADMAARCVAMNGLDARIHVRTGDARAAMRDVGHGTLDMVVCNPPYYRGGTGDVSQDETARIARHGAPGLVEELIQAAGKVVRFGGRVCMVYPAEGLTDIICALRQSKLEPKRLRLVQARPGSVPSIMLIDSTRGGKPGLKVLPPLILANENGEPAQEARRIYRMDE